MTTSSRPASSIRFESWSNVRSGRPGSNGRDMYASTKRCAAERRSYTILSATRRSRESASSWAPSIDFDELVRILYEVGTRIAERSRNRTFTFGIAHSPGTVTRREGSLFCCRGSGRTGRFSSLPRPRAIRSSASTSSPRRRPRRCPSTARTRIRSRQTNGNVTLTRLQEEQRQGVASGPRAGRTEGDAEGTGQDERTPSDSSPYQETCANSHKIGGKGGVTLRRVGGKVAGRAGPFRRRRSSFCPGPKVAKGTTAKMKRIYSASTFERKRVTSSSRARTPHAPAAPR